MAAKLDPAEFPDARNQLELLDRSVSAQDHGRRTEPAFVGWSPASALVQTPA